MSPTTIALGGKESALIDGHFGRYSYSLHLMGNVLPSRLLALSSAIPQFGDGLAAVLSGPSSSTAPPAKEVPVHVDLTSIRSWGSAQSWTKTSAKPSRPGVVKHR